MREDEKRICDDILRYGTITMDKEFTCDKDLCRQYVIKYEGETYHMTKINGEWVYIHREIEKGA